MDSEGEKYVQFRKENWTFGNFSLFRGSQLMGCFRLLPSLLKSESVKEKTKYARPKYAKKHMRTKWKSIYANRPCVEEFHV